MTELLANAAMVIILQYENVSNQHIMALNLLIQCYMHILPQFKKLPSNSSPNIVQVALKWEDVQTYDAID